MANPSGKGGFTGKDDPRRNNGGRTPAKWLHEFLDAASDKENLSRREAVAAHLFEVATEWEVKVKGRGEQAFEVASAADSIEAAKLLMAYDMGKPTESLEVESPKGTMSPASAVSTLTSAEQRQALAAILANAEAQTEADNAATPKSEDDGPVTPE
jgi:hypothetical protein